MVRGGSLLILRFVGQRSQLEQKFDTFIVSAQYHKYKKLSILMLRGTSLMNLRCVGQRSRSQFLKIEQ
jgi:hypothetical protein